MVDVSDSAVRIALAETEEEKRNAEQFVEWMALKWYACSPPPKTEVLFAARNHREVVGTIGLDFSDSAEPFRLEHSYDIDYPNAPWPFDRAKLAQYSRWLANAPNISSALIYCSAAHALNLGKVYGFGETKPFLLSKLWKFGMDVKVIPHRAFHIEAIPEDARGYYLKGPPSVLFMMELGQVRDSLHKLHNFGG